MGPFKYNFLLNVPILSNIVFV